MVRLVQPIKVLLVVLEPMRVKDILLAEVAVLVLLERTQLLAVVLLVV
jgi:hypothetical protein